MQIHLKQKPKNPVIIEGFPGFGLVATIATEFLVEHLNAKLIGRIELEEVPPVIAVHDNEVVEPLGIFYDKKNNIIILHALTNLAGLEWKISDILVKLYKDLKAKELISIEGVGSPVETKDSKVFYIGDKKRFEKIGLKPLKEGIIMGVSGALLLRKDVKISFMFAETHSALPDSRAAARIIETLDKYLGLKVDPKPLIEKAEKFESKLKGLLEKSKVAQSQKEKKELSYLG